MYTFRAQYKQDIFATPEDFVNQKKNIQNTFGLPFPEQLKVTLSTDSIKKIIRFYSFMKEEKVNKMDFYIGQTKDFNSFEPINNHICFSSNQYIDYDNVLFYTFKTEHCLVTIDKFQSEIIFSFFFSNSYTEECFEFTINIKKLLEILN